jgi:peptidoglycan/xylan/chitin deacetylase (PgdA/CDA1 family)
MQLRNPGSAVRSLKSAVLWLASASGVVALLRFVRVRILRRPRLMILCYHRVSDADLLFAPVRVSPLLFDRHVRSVAAHSDVVPLRRIPRLIRNRSPRDAVAFTFDDGYRDNLEAAAPILKQHGLTGSFFVPTGPSLHGERFWADRLGAWLEAALSRADLSWPDFVTPAERRELARANPQRRVELARRILLRLLNEDAQRIRTYLEVIPDEIPLDLSRDRMTAAQLSQLENAGHEIGAHTVSHSRLSALSPEEALGEVKNGLAGLRAAGLDVTSFAYPFGHLEDIGETGLEAARGAGVEIAVTIENRPVHAEDNPLLLPRIAIGNCAAASLDARLEWLCWKGPRRKARESIGSSKKASQAHASREEPLP